MDVSKRQFMAQAAALLSVVGASVRAGAQVGAGREETAIRDLIAAYFAACDRGDPDSRARFLGANADVKELAPSTRGRGSFTVRRVQFIRGDVALIDVAWEGSGPRVDDAPVTRRGVYVMSRYDGEWSIAWGRQF